MGYLIFFELCGGGSCLKYNEIDFMSLFVLNVLQNVIKVLVRSFSGVVGHRVAPDVIYLCVGIFALLIVMGMAVRWGLIYVKGIDVH